MRRQDQEGGEELFPPGNGKLLGEVNQVDDLHVEQSIVVVLYFFDVVEQKAEIVLFDFLHTLLPQEEVDVENDRVIAL